MVSWLCVWRKSRVPKRWFRRQYFWEHYIAHRCSLFLVLSTMGVDNYLPQCPCLGYNHSVITLVQQSEFIRVDNGSDTERYPRNGHRRRERPLSRWSDVSRRRALEPLWMRTHETKDHWRRRGRLLPQGGIECFEKNNADLISSTNLLSRGVSVFVWERQDKYFIRYGDINKNVNIYLKTAQWVVAAETTGCADVRLMSVDDGRFPAPSARYCSELQMHISLPHDECPI